MVVHSSSGGWKRPDTVSGSGATKLDSAGPTAPSMEFQESGKVNDRPDASMLWEPGVVAAPAREGLVGVTWPPAFPPPPQETRSVASTAATAAARAAVSTVKVSPCLNGRLHSANAPPRKSPSV